MPQCQRLDRGMKIHFFYFPLLEVMVTSLGSRQSWGIPPVVTRTVGFGDGLSERRAGRAAVQRPIHGTGSRGVRGQTGTRRYSSIRRLRPRHRFLGRRAVTRKSASTGRQTARERQLLVEHPSAWLAHHQATISTTDETDDTTPPSCLQPRPAAPQWLPSGSRPAKPGWNGPRAVDAPRGCMSAMSCSVPGGIGAEEAAWRGSRFCQRAFSVELRRFCSCLPFLSGPSHWRTFRASMEVLELTPR